MTNNENSVLKDGMTEIPTYFDSRPVIIEMLQVLNKYPLSYWHFKSIIEDLIQEVDASTPLVIDKDILGMVVDK